MYKILASMYIRKRPQCRPNMHKRKDNIKMFLKQTGVGRIQVHQEQGQIVSSCEQSNEHKATVL